MTYKEECVANFTESIKGLDLEKYIIDYIIEVYSSGFDFGSLNGASEDVKKTVVKNSKPITDENARDILEKIKSTIY